MAEDLEAKTRKMEKIATAIASERRTLSDLANRAWNVTYAIFWVGTLRAEDQEEFVRIMNEKPRLDGRKRNWKAKNLTFLEATIFGTIGAIEHYIEAKASAPVGILSNSASFLMYWGMGVSLFKAYYSYGKNGKPMASYSPKGIITNGTIYLIKKHKERRIYASAEACGGS